MRRNPSPPNIQYSKHNNNNLYEYSPYKIDEQGNVLLDLVWWNSLNNAAKDLIKQRVDSFKLEPVPIPHEGGNVPAIYQSYIDSFDYNIWYSEDIPNGPSGPNGLNGPNGIVLINIDNATKELFLKGQFDTEFRDLVNSSIEKDKKYFVRLSGTSGKNEVAPTPFDNADDIVSHLISVKTFHSREYVVQDKPTYLVLIPWNDNIDSRNEFRIFVVNNKLTAASPQKWWIVHHYSPEELQAVENALNDIKFIGKVPYKSNRRFDLDRSSGMIYTTFVGDVYIDFEKAECYLIELNPFGAHCGAGSSLFNWIDDYDQLYGYNDTSELRYLSVIKY